MPSLLRVALVFLVGCSAETFVGADAGTDASSDASDAASDAASDGGGIEAGQFECNAGTCGSATSVCCANFQVGSGTFPFCGVSSASTKCELPAACLTQFPGSCSSPGVVRVCLTAQDCDSDPANKKCCSGFAGGIVGKVCVSDLVIANYPGLTCN